MKYIVTILVLSLSLMAADAAKSAKELGVYSDYNTALQKAKSENKLMILVVVWDPCKACDKLVKNTLANTKVKNSLKNHVLVILDYKDKMPKKFRIKMAPKIFYIDSKTEEKIGTNVGIVSVEEFIDNLNDAADMLEEA